MFLIQDGHHASGHIPQALADNHADGVIWSPADETPDLLAERVSEAGAHHATQAIDPQLYVAQLEDANPKRLLAHELFEVPLRQFSSRRLGAMVERVIDHQATLPVTHLVSPTVAVSAVSDRSAQIALNLAETSLEVAGERADDRPLFLSAALERDVLADSDAVNAVLDELTGYDADGFYLLFEIDPGMDGARQAEQLAEALYIVHILSTTQGKPVWVGYAGLAGYLYRAVGAEAVAGGWFQKQQWWSPGHWSSAKGSGGRAPRNRLYLDTLLGSLLIEEEFSNISSQRRDADLAAALLAGTGNVAREFRNSAVVDPGRSDCASQLFAVCGELDSRITGELLTDLGRVETDINAASALYRRIEEAGIELEGRSSSAQIGVWRAAIEAFVLRAGISR